MLFNHGNVAEETAPVPSACMFMIWFASFMILQDTAQNGYIFWNEMRCIDHFEKGQCATVSIDRWAMGVIFTIAP
ncbi:hypothetical protein LENED_000487 [Lentinula edodes]|uniref:Uncharacterized protein n=1 Tax=Lentinula edodes TaxID=5353 RepID=A0A1Q3DVN0_LENED|nr:hypothetical protein LENED_000487 [Lentinula edodes]